MLIKKKEINPLDKKVVDHIRGLAVDMISEAKSGHPGIALGSAPALYTLYAHHLKIDAKNPQWINRDRFVLSAGHASSLMYSTLYMAGFDLSLEDLKSFRKLDSKTPGHPEYQVTAGVDISTGPLGQGLAGAVGMAIGERFLHQEFEDVIDFNTYCLCSDGDLMEGISYEAASLAGHLKLSKLIVLYDSNHTSLDGDLSFCMSENIKARFEAMNWNVLQIADGEDINSISESLTKAKNSDRPTLIEIKTTIGKFSLKEGTSDVHGSVLSKEDQIQIKQKLSLREIPFQVSDEALHHFQQTIENRVEEDIAVWMKSMADLDEEKRQKLEAILNQYEPIKLKDLYYEVPNAFTESTRETSGKILQAISEVYPFLLGGSADTARSTYAFLQDPKRNIHFGVREHAMGAIANGLATLGLTPFVSTFLAFSDYMKPSIRMSAMMQLPVIYVFTHDSITVGEDGPTHQPIEQLIALRSIPSFDVYRPADANEVLGSYKAILESRKPAAIILGRNKVPLHENTSVNEVKNGAYIVHKEAKRLDCILITTGEEINISLEVTKGLLERGIDTRLISMPCMQRFVQMPSEYQKEMLPEEVPVFAIEASSAYSWDRFVKNRDYCFCIDEFGKSGSKQDLLEKFHFTKEEIISKIEQLLP